MGELLVVLALSLKTWDNYVKLDTYILVEDQTPKIWSLSSRENQLRPDRVTTFYRMYPEACSHPLLTETDFQNGMIRDLILTSHICTAVRLYNARIGTHTILLGRSCLDLRKSRLHCYLANQPKKLTPPPLRSSYLKKWRPQNANALKIYLNPRNEGRQKQAWVRLLNPAVC